MLTLSDYPAHAAAIETLTTAKTLDANVEAHRLRIAIALTDQAFAHLHPQFIAVLSSFASRSGIEDEEVFTARNTLLEEEHVGP